MSKRSNIFTATTAVSGLVFASACSSASSAGPTDAAAGSSGSAGAGATGGAGGTGGTGGSAGSSGSAGGGATGGAGGAAGVGGSGGPWSCVGQVVYPQAPAVTLAVQRRFYHFSKTLGDPADGAPYEGATIDACAKDSDCATPLDSGVTNAMGDVSLTLPTPGVGFEGFLRLRGTDIVTIDLHVFPPIADGESRWLAADWKPAVLTKAALPTLTNYLGGVAPDPTKGGVITTTIDCTGAFAQAVSVTVNGLAPSKKLGSDSVWVNVVPGPIEVVGTLATGQEIGRVTRTVTAGEFTAVNFGPTPVP